VHQVLKVTIPTRRCSSTTGMMLSCGRLSLRKAGGSDSASTLLRRGDSWQLVRSRAVRSAGRRGFFCLEMTPTGPAARLGEIVLESGGPLVEGVFEGSAGERGEVVSITSSRAGRSCSVSALLSIEPPLQSASAWKK